MPERFRISIAVDELKHRIEMMLTEQMGDLNEEIKIAVGMVFKEFNLGAYIREEVRRELQRVMSKVIAEAVESALKQSHAFRKRVEAGVVAALEQEPIFPDFAARAKELLGVNHPSLQDAEEVLRSMWHLGRRGF